MEARNNFYHMKKIILLLSLKPNELAITVSLTSLDLIFEHDNDCLVIIRVHNINNNGSEINKG